MGDAVPDWSALQTDLLRYITRFLPSIEDLIPFRGVCTSWRAAAKSVTVSKVPLLMLAEKKGGSDVREFYCLFKRKICLRIPLPDAMGKSCIDVGFGWILTLASSGEVCLLNPFSAARIKLPNVRTFPEYKKIRSDPVFHFIKEAVLTANPSETPNFTLLVVRHQHLGFWRNGDAKWAGWGRGITMVYCKGKVHTLDFSGHVLTWDPQGTGLTEPQGKVKVDNVPTHLHTNRRHYLVASSNGELLVIERNNTGTEEYIATGANHFGVMRVDLVKGECKEIHGLGKDAIFLGNSAAVALDATEFPGVLKPNCIYFTDDCRTSFFYSYGWFKGGGKDMGIYNVEDRSIERFNVKSFSRVCPPLWVFPSF